MALSDVLARYISKKPIAAKSELRETKGDMKNWPLPGFDAERYLELNHDVRAAVSEAADPLHEAAVHFAQYGADEMRRLRTDGDGISDLSGRMLQGPVRDDDWITGLKSLCRTTHRSMGDILAAHPRTSWLWTGFSPLSYLADHSELREESSDPEELCFHFLEIGLELGWFGRSNRFDPDFIRDLYGIDTKDAADATAALRTLRANKGDDLFLALNEEEFLIAKGLPGQTIADIFDHQYYHVMASKAGTAPDGDSRLICLRHFCDIGRRRQIPFNPDMEFDPDFYRQAWRQDLVARQDPTLQAAVRVDVLSSWHKTALYEHWLKTGIYQGRAPNLSQFVRREYGIMLPPAIDLQLSRFVFGTPELDENITRFRAIQALFSTPQPGAAWMDLSDPSMQAFIVDLADYFVVKGLGKIGEWLYCAVLRANPDHQAACQKAADVMQRAGRTSLAVVLRSRVTPDRASSWNITNLAQLCMEQGDMQEAARLLAIGRDLAQADVALRKHLHSLARQLFDQLWKNAKHFASLYGVQQTQAFLKAALEACSPPSGWSGSVRTSPIRRVALVVNEDLPQCKLYRIDQKAEQLRAAGFNVNVFPYGSRLADFRQSMSLFDAVILFRVPAFPDVIEAIAAAADHGLATFYEIDDVVFDTEHFPPPFESYANQISREQYDVMACGVPLFEHAMRLCEYGIASTATIRELMSARVRSGQVFEHHNALGSLHMAAIAEGRRPKINNRIVIFYGSGTRAHKQDFHDLLEPALAAMVRKYRDRVEIRLIGYFDTFRHLDPKRDPLVLSEPGWDFTEYCRTLADVDINLSVLEPSLVTDAKSEIKWMEAAMFGIPSVLSDTRTHRETIEDGVTGLLCRTKEEFAQALERLIISAELRETIGNAARKAVLETYSIEVLGQNLTRIFDTVRPNLSMPRKRLMVVNVFYPPQSIGGATRVVQDNVTMLKEWYGEEFEIDVLCTLEGSTSPYEVQVNSENGVRVWSVGAPSLPDIDANPQDARMARIFDRLLSDIRPDLIHFHCIQRLTASIAETARQWGIPYVITAHDAWWISPNQFVIDQKGRSDLYDYSTEAGVTLPARARALKPALFGAKAVLPVSKSFAHLYRTSHVPNVIAVENGVSPLPFRPRYPSASGRVRLAHIGGISLHKGYPHVRNALLANDFRNLELLLIDHALPSGVVSHELWGGTPVVRRGKFPQKDVPDLYAQIDVLLAPSVWPESYGLVSREALASGAWVVASDRGAVGQDITDGENGFIVDVTDWRGVAASLSRIDADPERYRRPPDLKPKVRSVADQVEELVTLYRDIVSGSEHPRHQQS